MSDELKLTFQLTTHGESLEVRAMTASGEGRAETTTPLHTLMDQLTPYTPTGIPLAVLREVGQTLYQSLMAGDIAQLAFGVLRSARHAGRPVHFELRFDADQTSLAQYPWEMIVDDHGRFLVRDGLVDVTRYITYPQPPPLLDMMLRNLTLLQVVSQPVTLAPIAIPDLTVTSVETLSPATYDQLQHKLLIERPLLWGLHFDGHGGLMLQCRKCGGLNLLGPANCSACGVSLSDADQIGALAFEDNGGVEWVTADMLGSVMYNAHVQLAVLLACETARVGNQLVFNGLAPSLILAGVPAVVGMQYPVTDHFVNRFATNFYRQLLQSEAQPLQPEDLLNAMRTARRMTARESWYSPVLYLRHQGKGSSDEPLYTVHHTRNIDTAVPATARAGIPFLIRLWLRRPETKPLSDKKLRRALDVAESVPIHKHETKAEIEFRPVESKKLRQGEVEVRLDAINCDVVPESIKLFVDEHLDAPPAIFCVQARQTGCISVMFSVWQDGGQIASVSHTIEVVASKQQLEPAVNMGSHSVPVQGAEVPEPLVAHMSSKQINIASVRSLLKNAFTVGDLWRFCQERPDFRPVLDRIERNPSLESMIDALTEYCRTRALFPELLAEIRNYNPNQYQRHSEYLYEEVESSSDAPEAKIPDVDAPQEPPPGGSQNVHFDGPVYANDVIVSQGDVHVTKGSTPSSAEPSEPERGLVRLMAALVGFAGIVGAVIWLQKAVPGLTPEFLIPLLAIIAAIVLGALGILKPDQIAAILMGRRDGVEK